MDEMNKHPEEQEASAHDNDVASEPVANTPVPKAHIPKLPFLIGGIIAFAVIISVVMIALFGGESHHHSFGEWLTTKNPTCTEKGMKVRYCDCGEKLIGSIDATGHNEKVILGKEATCTEEGISDGKICSNCDKVLVTQESIPLKVHVYDDKYDESCNVCGFVRDADCEHTDIVIIPAVSPTCAKNGLSEGTKCAKCKEILVGQTVIDKLPHNTITDDAIKPTCTESGLTEGKHCLDCFEVVVDQKVIDPLGHSVSSGVCTRCKAEVTFTISTVDDLLNMDLDENYILLNDIDLGGMEWTPIYSFKGSIDGNGYIISNFKITNPNTSRIGFFGYNYGTIKNLGLENFTIEASVKYDEVLAGGLVGQNIQGIITNCFAIGDVTSSCRWRARVGGLVGYNDNGTITDCYAIVETNASSYNNLDGTAQSYAGGLIGYNYGGTITNCHSTGNVISTPNSSSSSSYGRSGGLIGYNENGTITDCYATGNASVACSGDIYYAYAGGLIGQNKSGNITNCFAMGESISNSNLSISSSSSSSISSSFSGGLIGENDEGVISNCYATGKVVSEVSQLCGGGSYAGGLIGFHDVDGNIANCYATGDVSSNAKYFYGHSYAGGLLGYAICKVVTNCYATGNVNSVSDSLYGDSGSCAGGLVGCGNQIDQIANCYAIGKVNSTASTTAKDCKGTSFAGGLAGFGANNIINCFAVGDIISVSDSNSDEGNNCGGLIGYGFSTINSYCNSNQKFTITKNGVVSYQATNTEGTKVENEKLQSRLWVKNNLFGVTEIDIWDFSNGYPTLNYDVINNTIIKITSAEDLMKLQGQVLSLNYVLETDIDLNGKEWVPILILAGNFDGNGYKIHNYKITQAYYTSSIGFFEHNYGAITRLGLENFTINTYSYTDISIGGLVGKNYSGAITNCYTTGDINIHGFIYNRICIGGLVGKSSDGKIFDCYTTGNVKYKILSETSYDDSYGGCSIGALIGMSDSCTISNCFSTGDIKFNNDDISYYYADNNFIDVGGLIGENDEGVISNCYATGNVDFSFNILVKSNNLVGGLIGYNENGTITDCYATGNVKFVSTSSSNKQAGGLVGWNSGNITDCYAIGNVEYYAFQYIYRLAGGLVGYNEGLIVNCYAIGNVYSKSDNGSNFTGGLVGSNAGTINSCYAVGNVSSISDLGDNYAGGLVGSNSNGTITNCYRCNEQSFSVTFEGSIFDESTNSIGNVVDMETLQSVAFHIDILGWSVDNWEFAEGTYPTL